MEYIGAIKVCAALIEVGGILFLCREVIWAQNQEKILHHQSLEASNEALEKEKEILKNRREGKKIIADELVTMGMAPDSAEIFVRQAYDLDRDEKYLSPIKDLKSYFEQITVGQVQTLRRRWLIFGVSCLVAAILLEMIVHFLEPHDVVKPMPCACNVCACPKGVGYFEIASGITFDEGKWDVQYKFGGKDIDLRPKFCDVKKQLIAASADAAFIIGRHDQRPLNATTRAEIFSNAALAQRRADTVAKYLNENNECGKQIKNVVPLGAAPRVVGVEGQEAVNRLADRTVEVWGLGTLRPNADRSR